MMMTLSRYSHKKLECCANSRRCFGWLISIGLRVCYGHRSGWLGFALLLSSLIGFSGPSGLTNSFGLGGVHLGWLGFVQVSVLDPGFQTRVTVRHFGFRDFM